MIKLGPPFAVGEKRPWLYRDTIGGASPMEWVGTFAVLASAAWATAKLLGAFLAG